MYNKGRIKSFGLLLNEGPNDFDNSTIFFIAEK